MVSTHIECSLFERMKAITNYEVLGKEMPNLAELFGKAELYFHSGPMSEQANQCIFQAA